MLMSYFFVRLLLLFDDIFIELEVGMHFWKIILCLLLLLFSLRLLSLRLRRLLHLLYCSQLIVINEIFFIFIWGPLLLYIWLHPIFIIEAIFSVRLLRDDVWVSLRLIGSFAERKLIFNDLMITLNYLLNVLICRSFENDRFFWLNQVLTK